MYCEGEELLEFRKCCFLLDAIMVHILQHCKRFIKSKLSARYKDEDKIDNKSPCAQPSSAPAETGRRENLSVLVSGGTQKNCKISDFFPK